MLTYLAKAGEFIVSYTGELNHVQWLFVLGGAVVVGLLCLKGFGSRKNY